MKSIYKAYLRRYGRVVLAIFLAIISTHTVTATVVEERVPKVQEDFPENIITEARGVKNNILVRLPIRRVSLLAGLFPTAPSPWSAPGYKPATPRPTITPRPTLVPQTPQPPPRPTRRPGPTARPTPRPTHRSTPRPTEPPPTPRPTLTPLPTFGPMPTFPPTNPPGPTNQPTNPPTAPPNPDPTATPPPQSPNGLIAVEQKTVDIINQRRQDLGLNSLSVNAQLTQAARRHSRDIHEHQLCQHNGTDGSSPWDRVRDAGYSGQPLGEVAGCGYGTAQAVVNGWWNSPGHKAILVDPNAREIGMGWTPSSGGGGSYQVGVTGR